MKNFNLKYFLYSLLLLFTLAASELFYIFNHPPAMQSAMFKSARIAGNFNMGNLGFQILTKGKLELNADPNLNNKVSSYLSKLPDNYPIERVYYDLGLITFNAGKDTLTPELFTRAINLDPNLSFWRVELANYYLHKNLLQTAIQVFDECMRIPAASGHCDQYMQNNLSNSYAEPVGFLEQSVASYYRAGLHQ